MPRFALFFYSLMILVPLAAAIIILAVDPSWSPLRVEIFAGISGNVYPLNNLLLVFSVVSYSVVLINLIVYWVEMMRGLSGRHQTVVRRLRGLTGMFMVVLAVLIFGFFAMIWLAAAGTIQHGVPLVEWRNLITVSQGLSGVVFVAFTVIDLLLLRAHQFALRCQRENGERRRHQIGIGRSTDAISFISVPALALWVLSLVVSWYISTNEIFRDFIDTSFLTPYNVHGGVPEEVLALFKNGFEAGVTVSILLISQLATWVLMLRASM